MDVSLVDLHKVYTSLLWLREHNPLYKDIPAYTTEDIKKIIHDRLAGHNEQVTANDCDGLLNKLDNGLTGPWQSDYGSNFPDEFKAYINKVITCAKPDTLTSPTLSQLISQFQEHKCNNYCQKSYKHNGTFFKKCRFGFPRPQKTHTDLNDPLECLAGRCQSERESASFEVRKSIYYTKKQFPLMLAFAITMNKSQGLSRTNAIVDAGSTNFKAGWSMPHFPGSLLSRVCI